MEKQKIEKPEPIKAENSESKNPYDNLKVICGYFGDPITGHDFGWIYSDKSKQIINN